MINFRAVNGTIALMPKTCDSYRIIFFLLASVGIGLLLPELAYADAGIPMIAVIYPAMLLVLFPVIVLETAILERQLRLGYRQTGWRVGAANA